MGFSEVHPHLDQAYDLTVMPEALAVGVGEGGDETRTAGAAPRATGPARTDETTSPHRRRRHGTGRYTRCRVPRTKPPRPQQHTADLQPGIGSRGVTTASIATAFELQIHGY